MLGALAGFLYFKNKDKIEKPRYNVLKLIIAALPFIMWFFKFRVAHLNDELYSLLFAYSVYQIIKNPNIQIDHPISKFLGRISYGIYLYHWIIILLVMKLIPKNQNINYYNLSLYSAVLFLTIFFSWLSYVTYERFFLNIKKKY